MGIQTNTLNAGMGNVTHDNGNNAYKEIEDNKGIIGGTQAALGDNSTGNVFANTVTTGAIQSNQYVFNSLDPGAIAAGEALSEEALSSNAAAQRSAADILKDAMDKVTGMAKQTQQGEVVTLAKTLGWIAAAIAGIWISGKLLISIFGKREAAHGHA